MQAKDQYGNTITNGGAAVKLTTSLGHFGSIGAVTTIDATDLGSGKYSAQLFSSRPGTATITGTVGGTALATPAAVVTVAALPPAAIVLVSGGGQNGTVGTALAAPAVVQVNAADGTGLPDVAVTFAAPSGASVGTATVTTDANGRASTTLTLATGAGTQSFSATAAGFNVAIPENAVAGPASAATSTITSSVAQINADNNTPAVITVHAKDQYGNVDSTGGATVTLTTTLGHWGGGTATTTPATDAGNGTYTATLLSAQSGTITITGAVGGTAIATPSVTINAIATVLDHFDVTLANGLPITGNQPAGVATSVRIRALDASGNVVAGYTGPTTLSITNSTFADGTHSVAAPLAVAGIITTDVRFGIVGSNVTLDASSAAKIGHSAAFSVVAGAPVAMVSSDTTIVYTVNVPPNRLSSGPGVRRHWQWRRPTGHRVHRHRSVHAERVAVHDRCAGRDRIQRVELDHPGDWRTSSVLVPARGQSGGLQRVACADRVRGAAVGRHCLDRTRRRQLGDERQLDRESTVVDVDRLHRGVAASHDGDLSVREQQPVHRIDRRRRRRADQPQRAHAERHAEHRRADVRRHHQRHDQRVGRARMADRCVDRCRQ